MTHNPRHVDLHVGARVRARRKQLGLSQTALAQAVGLTFQQIQKYERGSNRISCSMLWDIGRNLGARPEYFFDGLDGDEPVLGAGDPALREAIEARSVVPEIARIPALSASMRAALRTILSEAPARTCAVHG